ncbi:hypothetical protein L1887_09151 [Cichorium endivia]|nr:hypothetical protein L1887_09151 [Cichorium endivia]
MKANEQEKLVKDLQLKLKHLEWEVSIIKQEQEVIHITKEMEARCEVEAQPVITEAKMSDAITILQARLKMVEDLEFDRWMSRIPPLGENPWKNSWLMQVKGHLMKPVWIPQRRRTQDPMPPARSRKLLMVHTTRKRGIRD